MTDTALKVLGVLAPIACAVIGYLGVMSSKENKRLRIRLRIALLDCKSLYEIEETLCGKMAELLGGPATAVSVKRMFRAMQRVSRKRSPSEQAAPSQIDRQLERLG